jgi:hypothetical protein
MVGSRPSPFFLNSDLNVGGDAAPAYHANAGPQPLFLREFVAKVTISLHALNEAQRSEHNLPEQFGAANASPGDAAHRTTLDRPFRSSGLLPE